eukprot:TRINITY_DN2093_c2_g1_i1.p1 TRINITY_DN2093_c2_g1~~TRINITY_DN2093_c2_g1_i1.p1  ORF type:complete len:721 (-),score=204.41 TRINITY_DN2093_c2_g1_i1:91-2073(-)
MEIDSDIEVVGGEFYKVDMGDELKEETDDCEDEAPDPERLPRETEAFPTLFPPEESEATGRKAKVVERIQQEAMTALQAGDAGKAVERYTEGMRIAGSTPLMLANRAALLLKMRRPCGAIRDCTAAIKINSMILKAYRIRGIAHRRLGHWKKAHRDLTKAQSLNFDADTAVVQKFVAEKIKKGEAKAAAKAAAAAPAPAKVAPKATSPAPSPNVPAATPVYVQRPGMVQIGSEHFVAQPSPADKEFDQGQAVIACGLQGAKHLNSKRGVVQRRDPHPSRKGRWEVELRLDGGKVQVMALKAENIMVLNKADKLVCKAWIQEEKKHKKEAEKLNQAEDATRRAQEAQRQQEEAEKEEAQRSSTAAAESSPPAAAAAEAAEKAAAPPPAEEAEKAPTAAAAAAEKAGPEEQVKAKVDALPIQESVKALLRQLDPEQALEILEKADRARSGISNLGAYLSSQAKLVLGDDDDSDDEEGGDEDVGDDDAEDPEHMPEEVQPFPALQLPPTDGEAPSLSNAQLETLAQAKRDAQDAADRGDLDTAITKLTEVICGGASSALLLARRAELLLRQKRPCAAVRDCSAAIEVNPDSGKAHRIRGLARRHLGQWEDAQRDLARAQKLDFDDSLAKVQNFVALKVNALQERGPARRRSTGEAAAKKPKVG